MMTTIRSITIFSMAMLLGFSSCKKDEYAFGDLKTPSNLALTTTIAGANATNPDGDGTGNVAITATAGDALSYLINFGDGTDPKVVRSGAINYKYNTPGTFDYTITVNAIGTGGTTSTISKKIKVFVNFNIPTDIVDALTNNASKTWVTANEEPGHVGVGEPGKFFPNYYAATPNQRDACLYDDEITFTKDAVNSISMNVDSKGQSSLIAVATSFYGVSGGDGCYDINTGGSKKLAFLDATSASTPDVSTRIQFIVPGNGIINFGTGGTAYEILSITPSLISLRNIGSDGLAWYQKLKVKP